MNLNAPILLLLLGLSPVATASGRRPTRYVAELADGERIEGNELSEWSKPSSHPRLDGQALLDSASPFRWVCDRTQPLNRPPGPMIETFSGDRLPGLVIDFHPADPTALYRHFGYWLIQPAAEFKPPTPMEERTIRIDARFVRRIVWAPLNSQAFQPSTVFLKDGRSVRYRSLRPGSGELSLLTDEGARRVDMADVAELHFPERDFWATWLDELATLTPDGKSRLIQVETADGVLATASLDRLTAYAGGSERDSDRWVHGLQPAWSLDVLWIPFGRIAAYRSFAATECPISRIPPRDMGGASFEGARLARQDRNVDGGPLTGGGRRYGWGWGVHAFRRLEFPLPPFPCQFSSKFGLDRTAKAGGCVQARVLLPHEREPLVYSSPILVGSQMLESIGPIECPAATGTGSVLALEADPAHEQRPLGADPFDIRDAANWLDPTLAFDEASLRGLLEPRVASQVAAWQGWQCSPTADLRWTSQLRRSPPHTDSFIRYATPGTSPLTLRRSLKVSPHDRWLAIAVCRDQSTATPPEIRVSVNDSLVLQAPVPYRDKWQSDVTPLLVPLDAYAGRLIELAIELTRSGQPLPVHWQSLAVLQRHPLLREVFEDRGEFRREPPTDGASALELSNQAYRGSSSVCIPAGETYKLRLEEPISIRSRPEWGEFRFLRFVLRQQGPGPCRIELCRTEDQYESVVYTTGSESVDEAAKQVATSEVLGEWSVVTRDVYADFGALDAAAIRISATDGQAVWLDHVYVARSIDDFRYIVNESANEPDHRLGPP